MDGGGSHTDTCIRVAGRDTRRTGPPLNPASVGAEGSLDGWTDALAWLGRKADGAPLRGWIGAAEFSGETRVERVRVVREAAAAAGVRGMLWLTNDLVPLLLGPPLWGDGVVVAVGTGSSVVARSARSELVARVGGYEYVLADRGGGFDIGLRGLRAAARAHDGRGPATVLVDLAIEAFGRSIPELGRFLAELPHPKQQVAGFAERVCRAWIGGDRVAAKIVRGSVEEMASAAAHGAALVEAGGPLPCVVVGGIPAGCPPYFALLQEALRRAGLGSSCLAGAPATVSLELAVAGGTPPLDDRGVLAVAPIALGVDA
jgi:N-acetylglucosamine kinase-like BadF-type ATPase